MKTREEMVAKIKARIEEQPILDFFPEVILGYLAWDDALQFLSKDWLAKEGEEVLKAKWKYQPNTNEAVLTEMKEYMEFAWDKALNHRGLSANRSIDKMRAWCWLLGDEEKIDWEKYAQYGAPILKQICELYGFPMPDTSDAANMAAGSPCCQDCDMGCGK